MARSLGWLFVAGATIGLISLILPRAPHTNVGALGVNVGLAYLGGVIVLTVFRRLPAWTFHIALLAGTVLITRAVYYSGQGVSYYGICTCGLRCSGSRSSGEVTQPLTWPSSVWLMRSFFRSDTSRLRKGDG